MNKENNKSAAGLRRSAVAERIRLREEWSALKGPESQANTKQKTNILTKKHTNLKMASNQAKTIIGASRPISSRNMHLTNDVLRGIVALVEVGTECRALPLRAALSALGASVLPSWNPLVTHLIWSQGGCRSTRAKARALACRLVSPLWVEACAASSRRLPEQAFPAAARASDLPSPKTLQRLLKKAEMENIPLTNLLSESNEENEKLPPLRISSETEQDTSLTTDTSRDKSRDTTNDTSTDVESRVNTAPRRALPKLSETSSPAPPAKSRRKLFTHKEADVTKESDDSDETTAVSKPRKPSLIKKSTKPAAQPKLTQRDRKDLARAERMAKKILGGCSAPVTQATLHGTTPRIVLTGMCRSERREVSAAVRALAGRLQGAVGRRTTHVLLGSCARDEDQNRTIFTGVTNLTPEACRVQQSEIQKARTLNALCGAARGCRVLHARWALRCRESCKWLHHSGYEVMHLRKISQKARLERNALGKQRSDYAYDVFNGMRVHVTPSAEQRDAAIQLLNLCGAVVQGQNKEKDGDQNGGMTQNNRRALPCLLTQNAHKGVTQDIESHNSEYDIKIGSDSGCVSSKWVFDSVAAGRMRTARRYVVNSLSQSELATQMERIQC